MLSYFVWHSLPVNHFEFFMTEFLLKKNIRFGRCFQGTDHPSLVVIHRRSTHGRIYHGKLLYSVKKTVNIHVICAAFLDHPFCTHGQWSRYDPIDEDGSRRY
jgi:hypothetical protein